MFNVHSSQRSQISDLFVEKASTKISAEYSNFADVFSLDLVSKVLKHSKIHEHAIKLTNGQ